MDMTVAGTERPVHSAQKQHIHMRFHNVLYLLASCQNPSNLSSQKPLRIVMREMIGSSTGYVKRMKKW